MIVIDYQATCSISLSPETLGKAYTAWGKVVGSEVRFERILGIACEDRDYELWYAARRPGRLSASSPARLALDHKVLSMSS